MRSHSKALFAVAALFAFLLVPSSALAGKKTEFVVPTGGKPGGIAASASGDVYVQIPEADRIERYDAAGTPLGQFGEPGSGDGQFSFNSTSIQMAIDQVDGSIYVPDPGNNRIQKFEADGTYVGQFGVAGTGDGEFISPVAVTVDPSTRDVLVVDSDNSRRVQRFSPAGAFQAIAVDLSDGSSSLARVVIDSPGGIYLLDINRTLERFKPNGMVDPGFPAVSSGTGVETYKPEQISLDPVTDHLLAYGFNKTFSDRLIFEVSHTGEIVDKHGEGMQNQVAGSGLTATPDGDRYFVADNFNSRYLVLTDNGSPPGTVSMDPVTDVTDHTATFAGTVNPNGGFETSWRFEYSGDGGKTWIAAGGGSAGNGTADVLVTHTVDNLEPSLEYRVRLVATKVLGAGSATSSEQTFTTDSLPPEIEALEPHVVNGTSAWLGAWVNPRNAATTFYVEYSTDPTFATSTSVPGTQDASAGEGGVRIVANRLVGGLQPETTYHYRVVAANEAGTVTSAPRSLTTLADTPPSHGLPDGRVWEKVSPANKGGADVNGGTLLQHPASENSRAAANGEAVAFGSNGKFAGGSEGAPARSQYISRRGPGGGWSTEGVNVPQSPGPGVGNVNYYPWLSRDLSKGIALTYGGLNPGDPQYIYNLYLRDFETRRTAPVSNGDDSIPSSFQFWLRGVSADEEHYLFSLGPVPTEPHNGILVERTSSGQVRAVSVLPDGTMVNGALGGGNGANVGSGFNAISRDASHVYFARLINGFFLNPLDPLYVREDGDTTALVSASERADADPSVPQAGIFEAASKDGSVAYFLSPAPLTDVANPGVGANCIQGLTLTCKTLYRWEADAPAGERLTDLAVGDPNGTRVLGVAGLSDDGNSVYFVAQGKLDENGSRSRPNLYLWQQGEGITFIAHLEEETDKPEKAVSISDDRGVWSKGLTPTASSVPFDPESFFRAARVTPDGRHIGFASYVPQTAYDTDGNIALYLYDSQTDQTVCASCGTFAPKSRGFSWFRSCTAERTPKALFCAPTEYLTRNLSVDGRRLIFDSHDALVPQDTNGVTDVYQWQEGRLHLLSSGTSASASRFIDASADGGDVFFTTAQQLTPSDKDDLRDVYDARVGGQPEPDLKQPCVADECQGTPVDPPTFKTPSSSSFQGAGSPPVRRARCAKAKVRRKGRCVKRKARKAQGNRRRGRATDDRRAGR